LYPYASSFRAVQAGGADRSSLFRNIPKWDNPEVGLFPEAALIKLASSMRDTLRSPRQIELRKLLLMRRTDHGVTQNELAKRLGKPQSFVAKYEGGERRLSVIEFIDIAEALQIPPSDLLDELHEILKSSDRQETLIGGKTKMPKKH
jgi:hypothetical protein